MSEINRQSSMDNVVSQSNVDDVVSQSSMDKFVAQARASQPISPQQRIPHHGHGTRTRVEQQPSDANPRVEPVYQKQLPQLGTQQPQVAMHEQQPQLMTYPQQSPLMVQQQPPLMIQQQPPLMMQQPPLMAYHQPPQPHLAQQPHLTQLPQPHLTQLPQPHLTPPPQPHLTPPPQPHLTPPPQTVFTYFYPTTTELYQPSQYVVTTAPQPMPHLGNPWLQQVQMNPQLIYPDTPGGYRVPVSPQNMVIVGEQHGAPADLAEPDLAGAPLKLTPDNIPVPPLQPQHVVHPHHARALTKHLINPPLPCVVDDAATAGKRRRRKKRDPLAPKPPRYAWNYFFKEEFQRVHAKKASAKGDMRQAFSDIGDSVGSKWKALTPRERAVYVRLSLQDKCRHAREMEEYRKTQHAPNDNQRASPNQTASLEEIVEFPTPPTITESDKIAAEASHTTADILICDDDNAFVVMLVRRMQKLFQRKHRRLRVHTVASGHEAIQNIVNNKFTYGMVTVDQEMGSNSPSGGETVQRMRDSGYAGLVVGVSGHWDEATLMDFRDRGADLVLKKGSKDLFKSLETMLSVD